MIIAHLAHDKSSLLACCLTCSSWYIAAVSHLHHTLITPTIGENDKIWWPDSFRDMHKLGLFPLVKRLRVQGSGYKFHGPAFSPELFDPHTLHQFTSLINVQELAIEDLDIPGFMPNIKQHFHHFLPTVRSLALTRPRGSHRQIFFFIGLFQYLEDLKLLPKFSGSQREPLDDQMLVPTFAPPLRGRLTVQCSAWAGVLEDMAWILWMEMGCNSCWMVVQTRWKPCGSIYSILTVGKFLSQECSPYITKTLPPKTFELSRNRSLRVLEVPMYHIVKRSPLAIASIFRRVLSTITSPAFSQVTVIYRDYDFPQISYNPPDPPIDFKLVLCAEVLGPLAGCAMRELEWTVKNGWAEVDGISSRPSVTCSPRISLPAPGELPVDEGFSKWHLPWAHK